MKIKSMVLVTVLLLAASFAILTAYAQTAGDDSTPVTAGTAGTPGTIVDLNLFGITLIKGTQTPGENSILTLDVTPFFRLVNGPGGNLSFKAFGVETGVIGLIVAAIILLILVIEVILVLFHQAGQIIQKIHKRLNRSVNRTVIRGKAQVNRALGKGNKGAGVVGTGPGKKFTRDVFISYSQQDKRVADLICANLESKHFTCWIAPRDVPAGQNYQEAIIDGIDTCRIMVMVFSGASNSSPHVLREINRAVSQGATIIPFRIENVPLSKAMEYLISVPHWMEAWEQPLDDNIDRLAARVKAIVKSDMASDD